MDHAVANTKQTGHADKAAPQRGPAQKAAPELHPALQLQQQAGNQAMQQLLRSGAIRAKLAVSQPSDPEEQEADATADRIMRSHAGVSVGSSACGCADEENCQCSGGSKIARAAAGSAGTAPNGFLGSMRGSTAHPLDHHARAFFEPRFGRDFSHVRVHTDATAADGARAIDAHAFTAGSDIFFAPGRYAPGSDAGRHLLAHELTHVAQGGTQQMPRTDSALPIGSANDGAEREAGRVSARVMRGKDSGPIAAHGAPAIRRSWLGDAWDSVTDAASDAGGWVADKAEAGASAAWQGVKFVGNKVEAGAEAAYHGVKWVGNEAVQGAEAAGKWALGKFQNAWECLQSLGKGATNLISGDVHSLTDLLGIPAPQGADPSTLDTMIAVLKHPCLQMIPGYGLVSGAVGILEKVGGFLAGAWRLMQNPQPVIDGIKNSIGKMIAAIPAFVSAQVQKALQAVGAKAKELGEGVWRHLEPKLSYLAKNWWQVIKDTGWQLLWPWPSVGKDLKEIWGHVKSAADNLWNLNFSKALDDILAIERGVNSIAGALYGWFFIASVLVGAILGGIFGVGAGAIPGAGAGAAFAGEVGEGLLLATVGVESASILKAIYNLLAQKETQQEKETDYEQIASSSLTLAITGVMFLLSEIAVRFAKGLLSRVAGLFRRAGTAETDAVATGLSKGAKGEIPEGGPNTETGSLTTDDLPQLEQEVHNPGKVHPPEDPQLAAQFDAEVEVGEHTYRRSNTDGSWCRFSDPVCGIEIPEIEADVDTAIETRPGIKKTKPVLSDEAIDMAIERLLEKHNIDPSKIDELKDFIRAHPEELEKVGELMRDMPDIFETPEAAPEVQEPKGGSKPGELGKIGKDLSRAAARDVFKERWVVDEAKFTVKTPNGNKVNLIADMGTIGPGAEPRLVEAKLGSGAGLEEGQAIGYPILSTEGGVPANQAAEQFARAAFPGWKPGQPIPPIRVRIDWWSGTKRVSVWLP